MTSEQVKLEREVKEAEELAEMIAYSTEHDRRLER